MSTLKDMHYREQTMPDGCWNCLYRKGGVCCKVPGSMPSYRYIVELNGICDKWEKAE